MRSRDAAPRMAALPLAAMVALIGCGPGLVGDGDPRGDRRAAAGEAQIPDVTAAQTVCHGDDDNARPHFHAYSKMREIYERYFRVGEPVDFEWHPDPGIASLELVERVAFAPVYGVSDAVAAELLDFNGCRERRAHSGRNAEIFAALDPWNRTREPWERYNPRDWVPAAATYYARTEGGSDRMAEQLIFRLACGIPGANRSDPRVAEAVAAMADALRRCEQAGGCDDAWVALSPNDLFKIFEVRFVRMVDSQLQVSRVFRFVSVDVSGDPNRHLAQATHPFVDRFAQGPWIKWRGEISGRLYNALQAERSFSGATDLLVRSSYVSDYGCGRGARPADLGAGGTTTTSGQTATSATDDAPAQDPPAAGSGGGDAPTPACHVYAAQQGWAYWACEQGGNNACGGSGRATADCDHCCLGPPNEDGFGIPRGDAGGAAASGTTTPAGSCVRLATTINLNLRDRPETTGAVVAVMPPQAVVKPLDIQSAAPWWRVAFPQSGGWVEGWAHSNADQAFAGGVWLSLANAAPCPY